MPTLTESDAADLFRAEPTDYLAVDGGEVAHRVVGAGPDVLFVHGWPVSGATFRRLLPHLADHVTCHVLDLPGAGSGRVTRGRSPSVAGHIAAVRGAIDRLGLDRLAVVGHDSGGMIARHALAGDGRVRAFGLIDTELPGRPGFRFGSFVLSGRLPGFGGILGWAAGRPGIRRNGFVLGDAFVDRSLLDGEFDEFFLRPLASDPAYRSQAVAVLRSFDLRYVRELEAVHRRIRVPVQLVWGEEDKFFPVRGAQQMVSTFADARLTVVPGAGLFSHEERPASVAAALLDILRAD